MRLVSLLASATEMIAALGFVNNADHGMSGGPVVDTGTGLVVGWCEAGVETNGLMQNDIRSVNYALPASVLSEYLKQTDPSIITTLGLEFRGSFY